VFSLPLAKRFCRGAFNLKEDPMGLLELLLIVLVIAAVAGGIGLSPLLWLLLVVALVVFLTGGGFGYRRGGRV
jgi:hypothetical protein